MLIRSAAAALAALLLSLAPATPAMSAAAVSGEAAAAGQRAAADFKAKRYEQALTEYQQAVEAARTAGDKAQLDDLLSRTRIAAGVLGTQRLGEKRIDDALGLYQQALAISRERGQREDEQFDLASIGYAYSRANKIREAYEAYDRSQALARELHLADPEAEVLDALIDIALQTENLPRATRHLREAIVLNNQRGDSVRVVAEARRLLPIWSEVRPLWEIADIVPMIASATTKENAFDVQYDVIFSYFDFLISTGLAAEVRSVLVDRITDSLLATMPNSALPRARRLALLARVDDVLGDFPAAEAGHAAAIAAFRAAGDELGTGTALAHLAEHYHTAGQYAAALRECEASLDAFKTADQWLGQGYGWLCKARVLGELGRREDADKAAGEAARFGKGVGSKALMAAALSAAASGVRRPTTPGLVLQGPARDLFRESQASSLSATSRALEMYGDLKDGILMGREAAAGAPSLIALGELDGATKLTNLALEGARRFNDRPNEAVALRLQAEIALAGGNVPGAQRLAASALAVAEEIGDAENSARIWDLLARSAAATNQRGSAIFFRKQAVNAAQALRGAAASLSRELRASQTRAKESLYRDLAADLMRDGRLAETEQVLSMLKEEEFFNFMRRRSTSDARSTRVDATAAEQPWVQRYDAARQALVTLGRQYRAVKPASILPAEQIATFLGNLVPKDAASRAAALEPQLIRARSEFESTILQLAGAAPQLAAAAAETRRGVLQGKLAGLGEGSVALYYVLQDDRIHILLATPQSYVHREVTVSAEQLGTLIGQFRTVLQLPTRDPRPTGRALYDLLIAPVAADLRAAKAKTVMLALDGGLRYLPFAALYDGEHYLVESYAFSWYTAAANASVDRAPRRDWTVAALGVSEASNGFEALPGVPAELGEIVRTNDGSSGVLPGTVSLDAAFTRESLTKALLTKPAVLHIASHFNFDADGTEAESYLLLGGGGRLTLADFSAGNFPVDQVDLLTLSACQTGVGATGRDGVEVEGFAVLAQRKGAAGVMATLWPVADVSTSLYMREFYRRHGAESLSKAAAVRATQLGFIRGEYGLASLSATTRGAQRVVPAEKQPNSAPPFKADTKAPFAHPFYWAPFILMGNWL